MSESILSVLWGRILVELRQESVWMELNDVNDEMIFHEERVEGKPVMNGSLHADFQFGIRIQLFQKSFSVVGGVFKFEAPEDDLFPFVEERRNVKIFTNVNAQLTNSPRLKSGDSTINNQSF